MRSHRILRHLLAHSENNIQLNTNQTNQMNTEDAQDLQNYMFAARTHLVRMLREIATSLEQRNTLNEEPIVLAIAAKRECILLGSIIGFLDVADMLIPSTDVAAIQCVQALTDLIKHLESNKNA